MLAAQWLRALETHRRLCYSLQSGKEISMPHGARGKSLRSAFQPNGRVAQLAEHSALNRQVVGSIPTASTNRIN